MRRLVAWLALMVVLLVASTAAADDSGASTREAARHFQHGVALYGEADYRAALAEFKTAYALSPNAVVLYNVGQTAYQLQDWAGAQSAFERYLAEASASEVHREEVESDLEALRARTTRPGTASAPSGDDTAQDRAAAQAPRTDAAAGRGEAPSAANGEPPVEPVVAHGSRSASTWRAIGWTAAVSFAAGAIAAGVLAVRQSTELRDAVGAYPASSDVIAHDASLTTTYSLIADSLAGAAILAAGATLFSTLTSPPPSGAPTRGNRAGTRVVLGPASARLDVTF